MKRILFYMIPLFLLAACDSWLDIVPEEDMTTIDSDFETRTEAENWHWSCHMFLQDPLTNLMNNVAFTGADELVADDYLTAQNRFNGLRVSSGYQNTLDPYEDLWRADDDYGRTDYYTAINLCNIFIDKIDQVYNMEDEDKVEWKAEIKALKAYYYFELVRHYGPIILVPENIDPNVDVETMKVPRSHVDTCFQAIVDLCDEAAKVLPYFEKKATDRRTFFCKEAALALKARALCYQASDLFNGNLDYANFRNKNGEPLFSATKDENKWKRAALAAEEALQACALGGKHLVTDQTSTTEIQTHMANIEASWQAYNYSSPEVLLMIKRGNDSDIFGYLLPKLKSDKYSKLSGTCLSPSMKMVEMFYTENGLPIDQDMKYSSNYYKLVKQSDPKYTDVVAMNTDILYLHTMREPRFYANIAADRCYWRQGRQLSDLRLVEVYYNEGSKEDFGLKEKRLMSTTPQNITGYFLRKHLNSKAALTNYSQDISAFGADLYPVIRMAELYLIAAEAWNEVEGPTQRVYDYINVVRERAGIPDVEVAWQGARNPNKVKTKEGFRDIVRQEWNIEYAFEATRFWNLRRWKTAHAELNQPLRGWNVLGRNANAFYNEQNGPLIVRDNNKFIAPRDYFWPIRSSEIQKSGCVQNPGW